jgi:hypothetical protein
VCEIDPEEKRKMFYKQVARMAELCQAITTGYVPKIRLVFINAEGELLRSVRLQARNITRERTTITLSLHDMAVEQPSIVFMILEDIHEHPLYVHWLKYAPPEKVTLKWSLGVEPDLVAITVSSQ